MNQTKNATPKISVKGLYKQFGSKKVLNDVNFEIASGESMVILGGSGSGKSVLIKSIMGLIKPTKGEVRIDGTLSKFNFNQVSSEKISMLFQSGALFDSLPVWSNIAFGLMQGKGMKRDEAKEVAIQKLKSVGLKPEVADKFPSELSGGMQKRVSLARTIAADPEIIFFDEPTTGLDPIMANVINELIIDCSKEIGATTLAITHDIDSARKIADKIAMIYDGTIAWSGPADQLDKSNNKYIDQFINGSLNGPIPTVTL